MAVKIKSPEGMEAFTVSGWRETMTLPKIKSATTADEAAVIDVVTLAFSTDPVARWVYPVALDPLGSCDPLAWFEVRADGR